MKNEKDFSYLFLSAFVVAVISLLPQQFAGEDPRGTNKSPLRISSNKNSPAYLAFVSLDLDLADEKLARTYPSTSTHLASGPQNPPAKKVEQPKPILQARQQAPILQGLRVSQIKAQQAPVDWVKDLKTKLPDSQSKRLAQVESWVRDQDWSATSRAEIWKSKVRTPPPTDESQRVLKTDTGSNIFVAGAPGSYGSPMSAGKPGLPSLPAAVDQIRGQADVSARAVTIAGQLQMQSGLAFLGPQTSLVVSRKVAGKSIETGTVWVSDGRFEIFVKEAKGYLVAELRDRQGVTLGKGMFDLFQLPKPEKTSTKVDGILVNIEPVTSGTHVATLSAHSFGGYEIPVVEARVRSTTHDVDFKRAEHLHVTEDFTSDSTAVIEAESSQGPTTLDVAQLSGEERMFLLDHNYLDALVSFVEPLRRDLVKDRGFIIGRVSDRGESVAGARVQIAGDYRVEVIYFNDAFFPDRTLNATSKNGLYAAFLLEPSIYAIRAEIKGMHLPAKVVPVEANKVSQALIERNDTRSLALEIRPFPEHAVSDEILAVSIFGDESEQRLGFGTHMVQYQEGRGVFFVEGFRESEQEPMLRLALPHGTSAASLPVLSVAWLNEIVAQKNINLLPDQTVAFGWGADEDYQVTVDKGDTAAEVVYLNQKGEVTYHKHGAANGAFVIYNLSPGIHTISLMAVNGSKVHSRVVVSEAGVVSLVVAGN